MIIRPFWQKRILDAWRERRVVWLAGARRLGKTTLARSLPDVRYFDCDLPRVRRDAEDIEGFLERNHGARLVLDEIHRLADPSGLLKAASDHFPGTHVLATGSSTLGASARFRDTLAGRKRSLRMLPVLHRELPDFGIRDVEHRLLRGGLPEHLVAPTLPEKDYAEWTEAYWARDIVELFSIGKRYSFLRFLEMLWAQSGGLCQLSSFTAACEASRQTLANYLDVFQATGVVHVLRPYASHPTRELVAMPKVYAFDTGFVCHARGWTCLRPEDLGGLWEHLVLDELLAAARESSVHYWRDKQKHELDFVLIRRGRPPVAVECKWRSSQFDPTAFRVFQGLHSDAVCWVVSQDRSTQQRRRHGDTEVVECGLGQLDELLQ